MKIFLIILGIIIGVIILWILLVNVTNKIAAKKAKAINPLDWITTNSFMGFQLLDGWEFTLSRMHHLGMISSMDLGNQKLAYKASKEELFTFKSTVNNLKNVDSVTFEIYEGLLYAINITLKVDEGVDMYNFKKSLFYKYNKTLGKPTRLMIGYEYDGVDGAFMVLGLDYDTIRIGRPRSSVTKSQVLPDVGHSYAMNENGEPLVTYETSFGFFCNIPLSDNDKPYFLNIRRPIVLDNTNGNLKLPILPAECDGLIINNMGSPGVTAFYVKNKEKQSMYCG